MWKKKTKLYIEELNKNDLLNDIQRYKKLKFEELSKEKFGRKQYFFAKNLEDVRTIFKIKSEVFPSIRKNFSQKYKKESLNCPSCRNISSPKEDSQKHLMFECPTFNSVRENKDFSNDSDLLEFFKSVLEYKIENNED